MAKSNNDMVIPDIHSFDQILHRAREKASGKRTRAAFVVPSDIDMLMAFTKAAGDGLVDPTIIGDEELLKKNADEHGLDLGDSKIIDMNQPDMAVATAAQMAAKGGIDLIVKGRMANDDFLKLLFVRELSFFSRKKTACHIGVIKPERYEKLLFLTDAGVIVEPDLKQKAALIQNIIEFTDMVGVKCPRVALLAAVEVVYPQMPVTTEAAVLSKMAERRQIKGAHVDGPLSLDVAIDMFAAHSKGIIDSEVAGQADALVAPNIETANGIYTAMSLYGHAEVGGLIYGGRVPVALGSRSDSMENKYRSIVLGVTASA